MNATDKLVEMLDSIFERYSHLNNEEFCELLSSQRDTSIYAALDVPGVAEDCVASNIFSYSKEFVVANSFASMFFTEKVQIHSSAICPKTEPYNNIYGHQVKFNWPSHNLPASGIYGANDDQEELWAA